jgi:predicted DNA-binding transcriptional regulator
MKITDRVLYSGYNGYAYFTIPPMRILSSIEEAVGFAKWMGYRDIRI